MNTDKPTPPETTPPPLPVTAQTTGPLFCGLLNTNGVRIAHDDTFARSLAEAFNCGHFRLYLQFGGGQQAGQLAIRNRTVNCSRRSNWTRRTRSGSSSN